MSTNGKTLKFRAAKLKGFTVAYDSYRAVMLTFYLVRVTVRWARVCTLAWLVCNGSVANFLQLFWFDQITKEICYRFSGRFPTLPCDLGYYK